MSVIVIKEIGLVLFMQMLSLLLEYINTGTLKPSIKKRLVIEVIVLLVYISGLTVFAGMISDELITLIGTVYVAIVVSHLYKFLTSKKNELDNDDDKKE